MTKTVFRLMQKYKGFAAPFRYVLRPAEDDACLTASKRQFQYVCDRKWFV